jgi:hypothetical protein
MRWLPDPTSGQRLCGRPLGRNHQPWIPDLGQVPFEQREYLLCREHLTEMIGLVEVGLQRLQDELDSQIANEDMIFGPPVPHDDAAHVKGLAGRLPGHRAQTRVRAIVDKLRWKNREFSYAMVRMELVRLGETVSPTARLTKAQEATFRRLCDEGKVDFSRSTLTR